MNEIALCLCYLVVGLGLGATYLRLDALYGWPADPEFMALLLVTAWPMFIAAGVFFAPFLFLYWLVYRIAGVQR